MIRPTPKAGLDSWPCYFNENNKTLSSSLDEDDKPAKIFFPYSKLKYSSYRYFFFILSQILQDCMTLLTQSVKIEVYTDDPFS